MKTILYSCAALLCLLVAIEASAGVQLFVGADTLTVQGVPAYGSVYVYGVAREARGTFSDVVPYSILLQDTDGDSIASWTPAHPIALRSIWVAVDLLTGAYAAGTREGYVATAISLSSANFSSTSGVGAETLFLTADVGHFAVIRPGEGTWSAAAGATTGSNTATIDVSDLVAGSNSLAPPSQLEAGDIIVMINSFRGEYGILRVTP